MVKVSGYQPTEDQIAAAKARREAQAAEKAAKQKTYGGKTYYDKKQGKWVSRSAEDVATDEAKRAARRAGQKAKEKTFGGKTIFDKKTGKWVSQSADDVAKQAASKGKVIAKGGSKLGKIARKGGLIGLGIAALGAIGYGIYSLFGGDDKKVKEETPITSVTPAPVENDDKDKAPVKAGDENQENPAVTPGKDDEDKNVKPGDKKEDPAVTPGKDDKGATTSKDYEVKKGDCVWNIAKQHLKDLSGDPNYKPTNAEILKHTKELMKLNKLEFEDDGYRVLIYPKDKLQLTA